MNPASQHLSRLLVEAYRPHVRARLAELAIDPPPGLEGALAEGEAWLRGHLLALLEQPFAAQPRGPLEVFQEAMRFPTEALQAASVEPVRRDPAAAAALPGDLYDLAPPSSASLGEEVWRAHLAWGAAKAAALTGPPEPA